MWTDYLVSEADTGPSGQVFLATVYTVSEDGVRLMFDGSEAASQKLYKQVCNGQTLSPDDRVAVVRLGSSFVVIGKIAYDNPGGGGGGGGGGGDDYVKKTGDTMTGDLKIRKVNAIVRHDETSLYGQAGRNVPAESQYLGGDMVYDADGKCVFYSRIARQVPADVIYRSFVVQRLLSDGVTVKYNGFYLRLDPEGNPTVTFTSTDAMAAWVEALNVLSRTGGTLTGGLTEIYDQPAMTLKSSSVDTAGGAISDAKYLTYAFRDKNNNYLAFLQAYYATNGLVGLNMGARRLVGGANETNNVILQVAANGTRSVSISHPAAWRKGLELCYAANDTINSGYHVTAGGLLTGNTKTVYFVVNTPKSMENISSVAVTEMSGRIFGVSGALDSLANDTDYTTNASYTVSAVKVDEGRIRVTVTKATEFTNAANATPVTYFGTLKFKFT